MNDNQRAAPYRQGAFVAEKAGTHAAVVVTVVVVTMAMQTVLASLDARTTLTTAVVWLLAGWLAATMEPDWRRAARCILGAAAIGGVMALTLQSVASSPSLSRESLIPLMLLFAETLCRTVLSYAAGVFGCLAVAATRPRWASSSSPSAALRRGWS